jgi:hypothetical protein
VLFAVHFKSKEMTAVEWLEYQYIKHSGNLLEMRKSFEQAKELEKQQIKDAYMKWYDGSNDYADEEYYNQTFKSE